MLQTQVRQLFMWLKNRPWHWYAAMIITVTAGFLRLYRIPETVMFQGDQGRDALIVSRIFKELDPVFIGPVTSVGNMYLGPLYYYFMLPFLWLSYPSALGPVYAVAVLNTVTVFLLYHVGRKMFNYQVGLLSSFFLAFSTVAINTARFSWNPNLAPLVSLVMIYYSWKALKKPRFWPIVAICFSILVQLHYLTLLTAVSAGLLWLYQLIKKIINKNQIQHLLKPTLLSIFIFLISLTPLVLFDLKHAGLNAQAFKNLLFKEEAFASQEQSFGQTLVNIVKETEGRAMHILFEYNLDLTRTFNRILTITFLTILTGSIYKSIKSKQYHYAYLTVTSYLLVGILGTAVYQHTIFNHYIAYLFPVTALVYGLVLKQFLSKKILWPLLLAFAIVFCSYNVSHLPLTPNYSYQRIRETTDQIYQHLNQNEVYDLVLLSPSKDLYGQNYRYFLSTTDIPPLKKSSGRQPETLIIIDEEKQERDVAHLPIYEIISFPEKDIDLKLDNQQLPDIYFLRREE